MQDTSYFPGYMRDTSCLDNSVHRISSYETYFSSLFINTPPQHQNADIVVYLMPIKLASEIAPQELEMFSMSSWTTTYGITCHYGRLVTIARDRAPPRHHLFCLSLLCLLLLELSYTVSVHDIAIFRGFFQSQHLDFDHG